MNLLQYFQTYPGREWQRKTFSGKKGRWIVPFITFDNSRGDNETCLLLDIRSPTNPPDLVISSLKIMGKTYFVAYSKSLSFMSVTIEHVKTGTVQLSKNIVHNSPLFRQLLTKGIWHLASGDIDCIHSCKSRN